VGASIKKLALSNVSKSIEHSARGIAKEYYPQRMAQSIASLCKRKCGVKFQHLKVLRNPSALLTPNGPYPIDYIFQSNPFQHLTSFLSHPWRLLWIFLSQQAKILLNLS
jgi:hypothetical protein